MNLITEAKKMIDKYCEDINDPYLAEIHRTLLESDVQWLNTQVFAIGQILDNPQVELFGKKNIDNWESLNNNEKIAKLFSYFNGSGALADIRDYVDTSPEISPTKSKMFYDFLEVDEPFNGNQSQHLEQLKNSDAFKDIIKILLRHI